MPGPAGTDAHLAGTANGAGRTGDTGRAAYGSVRGLPDDLDIPDAEDMASPVQAELTGMDLIQRELGGKIIGEIDD